MIGRRLGTVSAVVVAGALLLAPTASAHVGVDHDEVAAGASTTLSFSVSHGCGESPTTSMRFQIPDGVDNAVPQVHPGWDIDVERAALPTPTQSSHGQTISDRPAVVTFTARDGAELPGGQRDTFTLTFTAPEAEGLLHFPVIQGCVDGSNDWIEQWDGTGEEPDRPAPSVMVVAAAGDASDGQGDDGSSDALAIVGIVVGAAGLIAGGAALARSARKPATS